MVSQPTALSIAGSDPSGGAGIQADLKTFHQFGVYGTSVVTLLTVQNTVRVSRVEVMPVDLVIEQLDAVFEDMPPNALKTGALGSAEMVAAVASTLARWAGSHALVLDPVMVSKHGSLLIAPDALEALRLRLLPMATLVTPNLPEAAELSGIPVTNLNDMRQAVLRIADLGPKAVLVKGGHLGDNHTAVDLLWDGTNFHTFETPRIATRHTHGTGCTYSAAITALLARGLPLVDAVTRAKAFIQEAIRTAPGLGHGSGPVNHWADPL
jgi:hydroxymethylpyrimidine/phosphomethylpyrimidine kinase